MCYNLLVTSDEAEHDILEYPGLVPQLGLIPSLDLL
jgi:hypothetical protein